MSLVLLAADLVALAILVLGCFLPRHRRRDLVVSYAGVNIGVLAVTSALATHTVSAGLGLGLFGVLSIIRLRSEELAQHEIAYYFAAITLGLLGGLGSTTTLPWVLGLMALIVAAIAVGDAIGGTAVRQQVVLDRAHLDAASARAHLESLLGGRVTEVTIIRTDLVNDTTQVAVRRVPGAAAEVPVAGPLAERIGR